MKRILKFAKIAIPIIALVYAIKVFRDTEIDTFQIQFETGEKEKFFITPLNNNLNSPCQNYQKLIMEPKITKLGDIFMINNNNIHLSAGIMIGIIVHPFLPVYQ